MSDDFTKAADIEAETPITVADEITRLRADLARKEEALKAAADTIRMMYPNKCGNANRCWACKLHDKLTAALADADTKPQAGG